MHGFFSKIMALGIVAAGFFLTGDLHWVMDRVGGWARGEVAEPPAAEPATVAAGPAVPLEPAAPPPQPPAPVAEAIPPAAAVDGSPAGDIPAGGVVLPSLGHERIEVAALRSGDRILARTRHELVAFDLIDPASGEAVEHRHALLASDVATAAALTTPRRVLLPATLAIGQPAACAAVSGSHDASPPPVGSIDALGIERPLD